MTAGAFADAKADVAKVKLLILQATSFCNIDCRYCYLADRSAKRRMSADTLEALISALIRDELLGDEITINWHAGEPLVVGVDFYRQAAAAAPSRMHGHQGGSLSADQRHAYR
jgi:sulfatase maturation enzyme AslB (radical SAM superfamily)